MTPHFDEAMFCALVVCALIAAARDSLRATLSRDFVAVLTLALFATGFYAQTHHHPIAAGGLLGACGFLGIMFRVPAWFYESNDDGDGNTGGE